MKRQNGGSKEPGRRAWTVPLRLVVRQFQKVILSVRLWALALLAIMILVRIWDPTWMQVLRIKNFDLYQLTNNEHKSKTVKVVDIDEKSLKSLGQWPWPRTLVARLVDKIFEHGAVAVGFDVIFAEPDRTSPDRFADLRHDLTGKVRQFLLSLPTNDARFAAAIRKAPVVLGSAVSPFPNHVGLKKAKATYATLGNNPFPYIFHAKGRIANLRLLETAAAGIGMVTNHPEVDGIIRRVPGVYDINGHLFPPLSLELLRVATGQRTFIIKSGSDGIHSIVLAGVEIPTDAEGRIWVKFRKWDHSRYYSAVDVLTDRIAKDGFKGKLVLIGTSAAGLLDLKSTPLQRAVPGVDVHAQLLENVLVRDFISRPSYAIALEVGATIIAAILLIAALPSIGAIYTLLFGGLIVSLMSGAAFYFYRQDGLLLDLSFPVLATLLLYFFLLISKYLKEEKERRIIRNSFGRYVSPAIVERLSAHPEELLLGGQQRTLTVLFSDIRSFTTLSQKLGAERTALFMNEYLTRMTDIVLRHNGTIDKFIGDAIMAFWNAPLDDSGHAEHALRSSAEMILELQKLNDDMKTERQGMFDEILPIRIGVGLNTGECLVGNFGSSQRFDYSALGDNVNIAARLEELTKSYRLPVLVSENTVRQCSDFAVLHVDRVKIRGRTEETDIFALVGDGEYRQGEEYSKLKDLHDDLMNDMRGKDGHSAEAKIGKCLELCPPFMRSYYEGLEDVLADRLATAQG